MIANINPYDQESFREEFTKSPMYELLRKDFDLLIFDKNIPGKDMDSYISCNRQQLGQRVFSVSTFYYLNILLEKNPKVIYDIGCGWNIFKKYIPNIVGVDLPSEYEKFHFADVPAEVNDEYIESHKEYFESAFSINALHIHSFTKLEKSINDFISMIKIGGRGFLAYNLFILAENTTEAEKIELFGTTKPSNDQYEQYIRIILSKINCKFLVVDIDFSIRLEPLNGNIRFVFER